MVGVNSGTEVFDRYLAIFELVFCALSLAGASIMVKLLAEEEQRKGVRPRLLLVLGSLDVAYSLFTIIWDAVYLSNKSYQNPSGSFTPETPLSRNYDEGIGYNIIPFLASLFYALSLVWTCCLGAHMFYVVVNGMCDDEDEQRQERIYWIVEAAIGILILIPVFGYVFFGSGSNIETVFNEFWAVWEIGSFLIILVFCLMLCKIEAKNPAAKKYQQQLRQYLVFFLVLMTPRVVYHLNSDGFNNAGDAFAAALWALLGASNAVVWGVSRTCLLSCVNKCLSTDVLTFLEPQGAGGEEGGFFAQIDIPIIGHRESRLTIDIHDEIDLSQLKLDSQIGTGAFGVIYKGKYQHHPVAIKQLVNTPDLEDSDTWQEFTQEAKILSSLRHPNIVLFYGVALTKGGADAPHDKPSYFIITELCQSSMDKGLLGLENMLHEFLLTVLQQIVSGMIYLHQHQIVHRDLKLSNVLLDQSGRTVKLCDFGLAKSLTHTRQDSMTAAIGTPTHMAPELIIVDKETLTKSPKALDIYSFGILMWCIISGKKPYEHLKGVNNFKLLDMIVGGERPEIKPEWPQSIVEIMKKCWDDDASKRPSMDLLGEMLQNETHSEWASAK